MTRYAKWLIFLNLGLSFVFLAWSIGLYTQPMVWLESLKPNGPLPTKIKDLVEARERGDNRWYAATREVIRLDLEIPLRRAFFAEQLKMATDGVNAAGQQVSPAVQQLQFKDGLVDISKPTGRPAFQIDGANSLSVAGYKRAIEGQLEELRATKIKINRVIDDTTKLTQQINGTKPIAEAITAAERGIRGELNEAITHKKNSVQEQEFLQSPLTNLKVELELLKRRQLTLETRLKELGAAAFHRVFE